MPVLMNCGSYFANPLTPTPSDALTQSTLDLHLHVRLAYPQEQTMGR